MQNFVVCMVAECSSDCSLLGHKMNAQIFFLGVSKIAAEKDTVEQNKPKLKNNRGKTNLA